MNICIFCGSNFGKTNFYADIACDVGRYLARRGHRIIYGGTDLGLMGAVSASALEAGGLVTGVIPKELVAKNLATTKVSDVIISETAADRKAKMAGLSDAFLALPGGLGTIEEIFAVWTWAQLNVHDKPLALLNVNHFYDKLIEFIDVAVAEEFIKEAHKGVVLVSDDIEKVMEFFSNHRPIHESKWF